eukprot:1158090-Pelagomonas_calceolata.AAC.2
MVRLSVTRSYTACVLKPCRDSTKVQPSLLLHMLQFHALHSLCARRCTSMFLCPAALHRIPCSTHCTTSTPANSRALPCTHFLTSSCAVHLQFLVVLHHTLLVTSGSDYDDYDDGGDTADVPSAGEGGVPPVPSSTSPDTSNNNDWSSSLILFVLW